MRICPFDIPVLAVLGFILALLHAKRLRRRNPDYFVFMLLLCIGVFWVNGLLSAFSVIKPWGGLVGYVDVNRWIGVFYSFSYPFWFWYAGEIAFAFFGRTPQQGGIFWLFTLKDKTEPFEPWGEEERKRKR